MLDGIPKVAQCGRLPDSLILYHIQNFFHFGCLLIICVLLSLTVLRLIMGDVYCFMKYRHIFVF